MADLPSLAASIFLSYTLAHVARGELHGLDDFRIGGAAAEVAGQIVADGVVVRVGMVGDELARHQDEAGRAEAALEGAAFDEGLLDRVEGAAGIQMLDGHHLGAVRKRSKKQAARHRDAIDQDGAAAAQALGAALTRPEQIEALLQHLDQILVRRDLGRDRLAVEAEMDGAAQRRSSSYGAIALLRHSERPMAQ